MSLHPTPSHPSVDAQHARLMRLATTASISVAMLLVAAKFIVWWMSDSLAMLSSLTDSLFDIATSLINFIAVRYALKPADDDHRFGHTGIEDIAGLAQFLFIVGAMLVILLQSVERLYNPEPLSQEWLGIGVCIFSMCFTGILVVYQGYVARVTNSLVVASDRMHYTSDLLFNVGVLLAFGVSMVFHVTWADPVFAIVIALTVIYATRHIGMRAFNNLMNREMPDADIKRIHETIAAMPSIRGLHELRTRNLGAKAILQLEIGLDKHLSFEESHRLTHELEDRLHALFPQAEIIIHADPV